jgi:hypothetical protein
MGLVHSAGARSASLGRSLKMKKLIRSLKETAHLLKPPTSAQRLLAVLGQRETRMSIKEFLVRKWVGKPNKTTKE